MNQRLLSLQGIRADIVYEVIDFMETKGLGNIMRQYRKIEKGESTYSSPAGATAAESICQHTGEHLPDVFLRISVADQAVGSWKESKWNHDFYRNHCEEDGFARDLCHLQRRQMQGRSFFFSNDGRIGILSDTAQQGDLIYLILGGEVPYVLRPEGDEYLFIGECYVHGLMDVIKARKRAQPDYDHSDTSWLDRLHEEPIPFDTQEFIIK